MARPGDPGYGELDELFDRRAVPGSDHATRSVIRIDVDRIADSCGYGVPLMVAQGRRPQREAWVASKLKSGDGALAGELAAAG